MNFRIFLAVLLAVASPAALAHPQHAASGFLYGFAHPLTGLDHVLAMLGVGIWAAHFSRWRCLLPLAFVACMAAGAALGGRIPLPFIEPMIALSVLVIGLATLLAARLPAWIGALVVGFFALHHGHAHFTEVADGASVAAFAAGMLAATALLHLTGLALSLGSARLQDRLPRALGGAISAVGAWLVLASY